MLKYLARKQKMQSPEAHACLVYLRNSKEGSVAGIE